MTFVKLKQAREFTTEFELIHRNLAETHSKVKPVVGQRRDATCWRLSLTRHVDQRNEISNLPLAVT